MKKVSTSSNFFVYHNFYLLKLFLQDDVDKSPEVFKVFSLAHAFIFTAMLVQLVTPIYDYALSLDKNDIFMDSFCKYTYYDPRAEHAPNLFKCLLAGLLGYLGIGFYTTIFDLILVYTNRMDIKAQGSRSFFTIKEWLDALSVSLFNQVVLNWVVSIPCFYLWRYLYGENRLDENDAWIWQQEVHIQILFTSKI